MKKYIISRPDYGMAETKVLERFSSLEKCHEFIINLMKKEFEEKEFRNNRQAVYIIQFMIDIIESEEE